jgi:hypothetical protein
MGLTNAGSELADRLETADAPVPVRQVRAVREPIETPSEELSAASV